MGRRWRWAVVAAVMAFLVALPLSAQLLPAGDSSLTAAQLLTRIKASATVPYSGFAQSQGGLALPVSGSFNVVDDLFGSSKQLRVWYRGAKDWRVDSIGVTGETDLYRDTAGLSSWDYEADAVRRSSQDALPLVRLPRTDDIVPGNLARRLLSEATAADVQRLPNRRIAGEEAAGLRLTVADPRSTVEHVDVWALPGNGLPLQVGVYGKGSQPVISTRFLDVSLDRPGADVTSFHNAPGIALRSGEYGDIVSAIDRLGQSEPPDQVAGLQRRPDLDLGSVGVYGRGITVLAAVPLSAQLAGQIVPQLRNTPGSVEDDAGISVAAGPINVQLSPPSGFGARWLLVGTLKAGPLRSAAAQLPPARGFGFRR